MNTVIFAHAPKIESPWALSPQERVGYLVELANAKAAQKWSRAFALTSVLEANTGQDYVDALARLRRLPK